MKSNQYGRSSRFLRLFDSVACYVEAETGEDDAAGAGDAAPAAALEAKTAPEGEGAVPDGDAPAAEAPKPEEPKRKVWWQDRIDQLTREKYESRQDAEKARQERDTLAALLGKPKDGEAAPAPSPAPETGTVPQAEVEKRAEAIANTKLAAAKHDERAAAVRSEGLKEHGAKFDEAVGALLQAGIELGSSSFVQAAFDTDAPAKVLFALGSDPERAMQFAQMSPTKMAIEMDRLARDLIAPSREVSKAPAPSPELRGASRKTVDVYDPKSSSTREWIAARERDLAARQRRG